MQTSPRLTAAILSAITLTISCPAAPVDLGTSGWEFEAPAIVGIGEISTAGINTTFSLSVAAWPGVDPVSAVFRTKPGVMQMEHFFWLNMDLTASVPWKGFKIDMEDKYDAVAGTAFHPIWAHIHPGNAASNYAEFSTLTPPGAGGAPGVVATGGTIAAGDRWLPTNIRLHDMATMSMVEEAGVMEFTMTLTPIAVPDSASSLALFVMGTTVLLPAAWFRRRRG